MFQAKKHSFYIFAFWTKKKNEVSRHKFRAEEKVWLCEFILKYGVSGSYGGAELSQIASQTILLDTISIWYHLYNGTYWLCGLWYIRQDFISFL